MISVTINLAFGNIKIILLMLTVTNYLDTKYFLFFLICRNRRRHGYLSHQSSTVKIILIADIFKNLILIKIIKEVYHE